MDDDDMDAVLRLNPALLLLTGNSFTVSGTFFDSHHEQRHRYGTVRITAFETPNVVEGKVKVPGLITREDVDERRQDWNEESDRYKGSVLAEFPERLDDTFVSSKDARDAVTRSLRQRGPVIVACDVARYGSSKTVAVRREGPVARIVHRTQGRDTMQTANFLRRYLLENTVDYLLVDEPGVGAGVLDRLREMGVPGAKLFAFHGGKKADAPDMFVNRTTECWTRMALAYEKGEIDTENDDALIAQVISRKYMYVADGPDENREQGARARVAGRRGRPGDDLRGTAGGGNKDMGMKFPNAVTKPGERGPRLLMRWVEVLGGRFRANRVAPVLSGETARMWGVGSEWRPLSYGEYYPRSVPVYAAIRLRGESVARTPLVVHRPAPGSGGEVPAGTDHPMQRLLDMPNPFWTRGDLWRATETYLGLWGSAFWGLERDASGEVSEIWPLRPDRGAGAA